MIEWLKALTPLFPALVSLIIYYDTKRREQAKEAKEAQTKEDASLPPRSRKHPKR